MSFKLEMEDFSREAPTEAVNGRCKAGLDSREHSASMVLRILSAAAPAASGLVNRLFITSHQIVLTRGVSYRRGDGLQCYVARLMAEGIVVILELVDIEHEEGQWQTIFIGMLDRNQESQVEGLHPFLRELRRLHLLLELHPTITTINLDTALAKRGSRVLLINLDPQGALSAGLGDASHHISSRLAGWNGIFCPSNFAGAFGNMIGIF